MTPRDALERLLARKHELEQHAATDDESSSKLHELRRWQQRRLEQTYGELRRQPRFAPALDFFLTDLYGPDAFSRRDADLRRALTPLKRALPGRLLELLCMALELQILTLELDEQMAAKLTLRSIDAETYTEAYRAVGRSIDRERQIDLIVQIGRDLSDIVRQRWMGPALRAAHMPAHLAGLGVLQSFLERGFHAFRRIGDASELLETIRRRETELMSSLLHGEPAALLDITGGKAANE